MRVLRVVVAVLVLVSGLSAPAAVAESVDRGEGLYVLETEHGEGLVERGGLVGLGSPDSATRWRISRNGGRDTWVVQTADRRRGWVVRGEEPFAPVRVERSTAFPTWPPLFPARQTWQAHVVGHVEGGTVLTITSGLNGWQVVVTGDYDPHLAVVPETFVAVKYVARKVGD